MQKLFVTAMLLGFGVWLLSELPELEKEAELVAQPPDEIDCGSLGRASLGPTRWVALTDFVCASGGYCTRDGSDGQWQTAYVPVYSAKRLEEPPAEEIRVVMALSDVANEDELYNELSRAKLSGLVRPGYRRMDLRVSEALEELYPGLDVANCQIVSVGDGSSAATGANIVRWLAMGVLAAGCTCVAHSGVSWFTTHQRRQQDMDRVHEIKKRAATDGDPF
jgi:hypothetical protein